MPISKEILDELIKDYKNPADLLGAQGLLKLLTKALDREPEILPQVKKVYKDFYCPPRFFRAIVHLHFFRIFSQNTYNPVSKLH